MTNEELKDKLNYLEDLYYRERNWHYFKQSNGFCVWEYEMEFLDDLQQEIRTIKHCLDDRAYH